MARANPLLGTPSRRSDNDSEDQPESSGEPVDTAPVENAAGEDARGTTEQSTGSSAARSKRQRSPGGVSSRPRPASPAAAEDRQAAAATLLRQFGVDPEHRRVERPVLDLMPVRVPREVRDMVRVASQRAGMTQQEWVLRAVVAYLAETEPVLLDEASST